MIDTAYFGYGVALPLLGYVCGVMLRMVLDGLHLGAGYDGR